MTPFLAAILHTLSPFAIRFPAGFPLEGIRWYGLSYLIGFFIGYLLIRRVTRVGISTVKPQHVGDLVTSIAIGVVLGGRLGYVLFYDPSLAITFFDHMPFWGVLALNQGGMASHGGMIGGVLALMWYARRGPDAHSGGAGGHDWRHLADLFAFGAPLGVMCGRFANFINGELLGRPASPDLPWAVQFPQEMYTWSHEQLATAETKLIEILPTDVELRTQGFSNWVSWTVAKIQAHDPQVTAIIQPMLTPRHPSQLYAAMLEGVLVFVVLALVWTKARKPGVVGGIFCMTYAIVRIIGEFFREPDAHLRNQEFAVTHITRGQWLSVLLVLAGAAFTYWFTKQPGKPMGGWLKSSSPSSTSSSSSPTPGA